MGLLDEDLMINNETNPKILIISGHDTTVTAQEIFLVFALRKAMEFYRTPIFAS